MARKEGMATPISTDGRVEQVALEKRAPSCRNEGSEIRGGFENYVFLTRNRRKTRNLLNLASLQSDEITGPYCNHFQ